MLSYFTIKLDYVLKLEVVYLIRSTHESPEKQLCLELVSSSSDRVKIRRLEKMLAEVIVDEILF